MAKDDLQPRSEKSTLLERVMELALSVDREKERAYVQKFRKHRSSEDPERLADRLIRRAQWWGAGWGVATGLPANPWVVVPAAVTDAGALLRTEVKLAVRIGLLYDPQFLDDEEPPYELLIPIFGIRAGSEFLREMSIRGAMGVTRAAIRKHLSKQTLAAFKRIMLKYFGLKVTQRGVIKGTLPVAGGFVGGIWNYREVSVIGKRVKRYFKGQQFEGPERAA